MDEFNSDLKHLVGIEKVATDLKDKIIVKRIAQISGEAYTYGRAYKIFKAIQKFQKDTKTLWTTDTSLDQLLNANGILGWKGPYIALDANEIIVQSDPTADFWGTKFAIFVEFGNILVKSAGTDREFAINVLRDDLLYNNGLRRH